MVTDLVPISQPTTFRESLQLRAREIRSWLCVGIDPDPSRLPVGIDPTPAGLLQFCHAIVDATCDVAVCFKINVAFFEPFGAGGWQALEQLRASVPRDVPVILDAKRGDIGNTSAAYARALFDTFDANAITVNPYLGWDSLRPFLEYEGRGVLVLCRTSNPGSRDVQELLVEGEPLYLHIARQALAVDAPAEVGLVVGATQPDALRMVRSLDPEIVLLLPGVGAQGATAADAIRNGGNERGENGLASVSRDVLYASLGPDFQEAASRVATSLARDTWLRG